MPARTAGIILIMAASSLGGIYASSGLLKRSNKDRLIIMMILRISVLIEYQTLKTSEILRELAADACFSRLEFLKKAERYNSDGMNFCESWKKAADEEKYFGREEKELISGIGDSLGKSSVSGQLAQLSEFHSQAENICNASSKAYDEKGKLFRSFGILAGAFISVMLV